MADTETPLDQWTWHSEASCRGVDAELFFPGNDEEAVPAKAICETCPVRNPCLAFALERGERYGVWGGMTERERARLSPAAKQAILRKATQAA
jgi:WhiB family redox-sensing transcriptional regulator